MTYYVMLHNLLRNSLNQMLSRIIDVWNETGRKIKDIGHAIDPAEVKLKLLCTSDSQDILIQSSLQYPTSLIPLFTKMRADREAGFTVLLAGEKYIYIPVGMWALYNAGPCKLVTFSGQLGYLYPSNYNPTIAKFTAFSRFKMDKDFVADYRVPELTTISPLLAQILSILEEHRKNLAAAILSTDPNIPHLSVTTFTAGIISHDIVFQQLDMIMTLLIRGIDITPCIYHKKCIKELHQLFINNHSPLYSYIRRPMSLYLGDLLNIFDMWQSFVKHPGLLLEYQRLYEQAILTKVKVKQIKQIRDKMSSSRLHMTTLNDQLLLEAKIKNGVVGHLNYKPFIRQHKRICTNYFPGVIEVKYVKINGVSFSGSDLSLFSGTVLYEALIRLESARELDFPLLMPKDIFLLKELLSGRCCFSYFYEKISKYAYGILSGDNTMIAKYESTPETINKMFNLGVRLREELQ